MVFGQSIRNGPSFWSADEACTILVANARRHRVSPGSVAVNGSIEGVPFSFEGTPAEIELAIREIVPRLVAMDRVDDVVVNGQAYRNSAAYWNAAEVVQLLRSALTRQPAFQESPARVPRTPRVRARPLGR